MAVYTVQVNVNVPGVGAKTFTQLNVTAASIQGAIDQAVAMIVVEAVAVQKTSA